MLYFLGAVAFLTLLWGFLVAPARIGGADRAKFSGRMYAHRGLYELDQSVPENSLAAFARAAERGYGIELDVQITSDGEIVVFHDGTLARACGVPGGVKDLSFAEVRALRLFGTEHGIPHFSEVLDTVAGRVPLIVELKAGGDWRSLCRQVQEMLSAYAGDACIESFDPFLVRWFKKNAPSVVRGQLSEAYRYSHKNLPWYLSLLMSRLFTNAFTRPHFIAYRLGEKCLSVRFAEHLGAFRAVWTVHGSDDLAKIQCENDAVIFEHFTPDTRY